LTSACSKPLKPALSYKEIKEIRPTLIFDAASLVSSVSFQRNMRSMQRLAQMMHHPMMYFLLRSKPINVVINSNGGRVDYLFGYLAAANLLKKKFGLRFRCYIKNAFSAAFTLTFGLCDERIGLKGVRMGQHQAFYRGGITSTATMITDMQMATIESRALRTNFNNWLKKTRQPGVDYYLTEEDYKKYKVFHKRMK
jgi:hypothetical protein